MTRRFGALFWRQIVRSSWRRPLLTSLNVLSIALGVAVFLAIQLANRGALKSFRAAADLTTGHADLEMRGDLPDTIFPAVLATAGVRAATPILEGLAILPDRPGEYLRILGIDPLTGRDVFSFQLQNAAGQPFDLESWLRDPEAIAVQSSEEKSLGSLLQDGRFTVYAGNARHSLRPSFIFQVDNPLASVDPRLAAMDLGWAQELLGKSGRLSAVEILLDHPADAAAVAGRLRQLVPDDVVVAPPASRSHEMESMLAAFQLNLTAMSLVSIIVGMLLIYNSVSAAVVRRRTEIAILRASGATRGEVRLLFLGEAGLEALAGAALGLLLAPLLAAVVAAPIEQSISTLYAVVRIGAQNYESWQIVEAFALGLGAALIAAWFPASEAARCDPARILHPGAILEQLSPLRSRYLVLAGVMLAGAYFAGAAALSGNSKWLGFVSAGAVLGGFSLLVPWLATAIALIFRQCGSLLLRLSANHLARALHRNAITIASLAAAVAMTVSVTVMIYSFRTSVNRWIGHTLVADLYISPAANDLAGFQVFLPPETMAWLLRQPEVRAVSAFREIPIRLQGETATLTVVRGKGRSDLEFLTGSPSDAFSRFSDGEAVAISESLATRFHLRAGSQIQLATPTGPQIFTVCGVYRDFSSERGIVMMTDGLFRRFWTENRWHSAGIKLIRPADASLIAERFRATFGRQGLFVTYDNAALRQRVFQIFDQTFAVTSVLRGIAVTVAIIGVIFSLSVLVLERQREIGVLRAVGAAKGQILGIFLGEAFLIGLTACVSGLASGAILSIVLTGVINKAFFGWTITLAYPVGTLLVTPLWLIPSALLAALFPAWRAARIPPAQVIRFE